MLNYVRHLLQKKVKGFAFSRPLVLLQSDDWGRVGVRDREGFDSLRRRGVRLGEHPYDLYSLETADDVNALASLLSKHRDSAGAPPCAVLNVCTANLDFTKMRAEGFKKTHLLPLADGLPGSWSRPGLVEAYRSGIAKGVFQPALHGATHFCPIAFNNALAENGERAAFLRLLWDAETPYIYWRMPWVGFEYWNPDKPHSGFLSLEQQRAQVKQACQNFIAFFKTKPLSACAPGCRANQDTHRAWAESGIQIAENGSGSGLRPPHMDQFEVLQLYRSIDFEPSHRELETEKYLEIAEACFSRGIPLVISAHAINFHSTLKDFRSASLAALDRLLSALERKYSDLLYVTDQDLYGIVTQGAYRGHSSTVKIGVTQQEWNPRFVPQGAV